MSMSTPVGKPLDTKLLGDILTCILTKTKAKRFYVIASNEMDKVDFSGSYPLVIIQNTDPNTLPGTHWVCYYIEKQTFKWTGNDLIYWDFFDSYGNSPEYYNLSLPTGRMFNFNPNGIQSEKSTLCGHFCLHFAYNRAIGLSFKKYMEKFGSMSSARAERVVRRFASTLTFCPSGVECNINQSCCNRLEIRE